MEDKEKGREREKGRMETEKGTRSGLKDEQRIGKEQGRKGAQLKEMM